MSSAAGQLGYGEHHYGGYYGDHKRARNLATDRSPEADLVETLRFRRPGPQHAQRAGHEPHQRGNDRVVVVAEQPVQQG